MTPQLRFQRHELKYYIPEFIYPELRRLIDSYMTLDPHLAERNRESYLVRSLYLDTDDLRFYREKLSGLPIRRKLRIRGYDGGGPDVFIEIKGRREHIIVKDRARLPYADLPALLSRYGGYIPDAKQNQAEARTLDKFRFFIPALQLRPMVLVAYKREAYMGIHDRGVRLTIDRSLQCVPGPRAELFYSGPDWLYVDRRPILELKFNQAMPFFFRRLIQYLDLQQTSISKYCLCLEKCGPTNLR